MNRYVYEIFAEAKAEMYKKLDELRKEYKPTVDEYITLNVLEFEDLHSVNKNNYGDYILGSIYTSNYFNVKLVISSVYLKVCINVELNTKYMKGLCKYCDYDLVNISKEEYNKIYAEIQLKEAKNVIKEELRKEMGLFGLFNKLFRNYR